MRVKARAVDVRENEDDELTTSLSAANHMLAEQVATLTEDVDHLRRCFEQLIDIVGGQPDYSDELALVNERLAFFERRMQRAEDNVADLSWAQQRRVADR
jgi:hypothetical protein